MYWFTLIPTDSTLFPFVTCSQADQKENAQKGTGISTLLQEGTELFLGENAGKAMGAAGKAVEAAGKAVLPVQSQSTSSSDVDFDETGENDGQVENPAHPVVAQRPVSPSSTSQVDHL